MTKSVTRGKVLILYILSISALIASLSQNIYTPTIPLIRDSFQVSINMVNFTVSSFIFIIAMIQILMGTVVDHRDKKSLLLISLILMSISAAICAYTTSFTLFILFRMVQAIGAGIIPLVSISMIAQLFDGEARASAMGTYQIMLTLAPAIAPVLGGFIGEYLGYEGIFLFLFMIVITLLVATFFLLPREKEVDISQRQSRGFIKTYKAVLSHCNGTSLMMISFLTFLIYFAVLVYLPLLLHDSYQISLQFVGLLYLPLTVSMILGSILFKNMQKKISLLNLFYAILLTMPVIVILFGIFHTKSLIYLSVILFSYGLMTGFSAPLFSTLISNEYNENRGAALGVFNFIRYSGMALGGMFAGLYTTFSSSILFIFFGVLLLLISILPYKRFQGKKSF